MTSLLWLLVTMSLSGTLLAGAVLLLTPLLKRRPALRYYLWLTAALRLVLPLAPEANLMAYLSQYLDTPIAHTAVPQLPEEGAPPSLAVDLEPSAPSDEIQAAAVAQSGGRAASGAAPVDTVPDEIYRTTRRLAGFGIVRVPALLWLFGACAVVLPHVWELLCLRKTLRQTALPASAGEQAALDALCPERRKPLLRRCPAVETPLTLGVLHPVIVLPAGHSYPPEELHYILLHELTHVRRLDAAYKWLLLLATGLHWFNPFVWQMQRMVEQACEQSCDEAVVRKLNEAERLAYCETLLHAAAKRPRTSPPAPALSEDARTLQKRMAAVLSYREPGRADSIGAFLLLLGAVLSGLLLGCTDGAAPADRFSMRAERPDADRAAVLEVCAQWVNAIPTRDADAREALMTEQMRALTSGSETFSWLRPDHTMRSCAVTPGMVRTSESGSRWATAYISVCMEGPDRLLRPAAGQLELQDSGAGWNVHRVTWAGYLEPGFMEDLDRLTELYSMDFPPVYTGEDLRRMEAEQSGLYGLSPAEAAVTALHLSNGSVCPTPDESDIWYHWAGGDIQIHMEQPEGHAIWVPAGIDRQYLHGFTFQEASRLILSGLPSGWRTEDRLPQNGYFYAAVLDPEGSERCTLAVNYQTGEILWADGGTLRPYHESPLRELLLQQASWESEFYPYGQEDQRTVIHKIGEQDFSWFLPDGSSGNGTFSGNQGWSDDGSRLFLWSSEGCNLTIYQRGADGRLLLDRMEQLQSDLFDTRYRERQSERNLRQVGITPSEALEIVEGALPDRYAVTERPSPLSGWYLFDLTETLTRETCTLAVNAASVEFRSYNSASGELEPYRNSPVHSTVADRCAWEGRFTTPGSPGETVFWKELDGAVFFQFTGGLEPFCARPDANQLYSGNGKWLYLWDGDTGHIRAFERSGSGAVLRYSDDEVFDWLVPFSEPV